MPGHLLLYGAIFIHMALGLHAFYRRRHLRMPVSEALQIALGLTIPLLLMSHAAPVRIGDSAFGMQANYDRVLYQYWVVQPDFGLPRQWLLLTIVWIHGCLGIRSWLRSKPWYPRYVPVLASLATLLPVLALLGFINAGLDMREVAANDPASLGEHVVDRAGTAQAGNWATVGRAVDILLLSYLGLLGGVVGLRAIRGWHSTRFRAVRITYPGGHIVNVPVGYSVLEASRWAGIPHTSVCGGRGRCSTCRVEILSGAEGLAAPGIDEKRLLDRISAPPAVRLACQIRPTDDISVVPLVLPASGRAQNVSRFGAAAGGGREVEIAALFVDMRHSTRLADDRLPYDALFLFDRYIQAVSTAIRESGGHVTNIAGDGIMSVFGVGGTAASAARDAFAAALKVWVGIDALNAELRDEMTEPFRVGIGLHVGVAVVGVSWDGGSDELPFLGDTGNVAARLEAEAKRFDCTLIASADALSLIAGEGNALDHATVAIRGKQEPMDVVRFGHSEDLRQLLMGKAAETVG